MVYDQSPIKIGYCLSLTGPVSGNSKSAKLAHEIWRDDINRRGGLLGRPVELICYDDTGEAAQVAALYRRLIDKDKVDLVIGGYGTNTNLAALPEISTRQRFFVALMALGANNELSYENYFAMIPTGPEPNVALTEGFFDIAARQTPTPKTVGILSADAVFARNPVLGAHENAKNYGFNVIYEAAYPLATTDFTPFLDDVATSKCDLLFLCTYLQDSIDLIRAIGTHPFRPKMVGASMIGPQNGDVKADLGPLLNGILNYEYWVPAPALAFKGVSELLEEYRQRTAGTDIDPLGHYMAPLAYAQLQVVAEAIERTGSLDDSKLSDFTRNTGFSTVMGRIAFGTRGEWTHPRVVQVQFEGIKGHDVNQFRSGERQVVLAPLDLASGTLIYPFADARST
ncbi:amino acid ABC transporter substrate-binding protein [Brucella sp. BE17]|uniref:amino acid ABC transporter substrate-binding protein n=1 Tax=Brucella sp. BE17 TaxID=3142977 RepID=UPI0031BB03FB